MCLQYVLVMSGSEQKPRVGALREFYQLPTECEGWGGMS
jgi:hypothetical protein